MLKFGRHLLIAALCLVSTVAIAGIGIGLGIDEQSLRGGGGGPPALPNCLLISGTTTNCLLISGTTTNALLIQ